MFGDFQHRGFTQILRIHQGNWEIASLQQGWAIIGPAPVNSVAGLSVGEFDSDGFAEVARSNPFTGQWEYTSPGRNSAWVPLQGDFFSFTPISGQQIGRFLAGANTDVLLWRGNVFYVAPSGRDPIQRISRQDMR